MVEGCDFEIKVRDDFISTSISLDESFSNSSGNIEFKSHDWKVLLSDIRTLEAYAPHPGLERTASSYEARGVLTRNINVQLLNSNPIYNVTDYIDGNEEKTVVYTQEDIERLYHNSRF